MKDLNDLLNKFKKSLDSDAEVREVVAGAVKEATGLDIRLEGVSFRAGVIRIKTAPAKRNAIALQELKILEAVRIRTKLNLKRIVY